MPVPMVRMLGSKMMSSGGNPARSTSSLYARQQMRTFSASAAAWPASSNAITTTAAPCRRTTAAWRRNSASPPLRLMLFTMHLPCEHFSPASITSNLLLSIMNGTRAASGSLTSRFTNRVMAATLSIRPSSMLMSITSAPASTCFSAIASAFSHAPSTTAFLKMLLPATLHRSPRCRKLRRGAAASCT